MKRSGSSSAALLVAVLCVACVADGAAILTVTLFLHFFRIKMASNVFFTVKITNDAIDELKEYGDKAEFLRKLALYAGIAIVIFIFIKYF